MNWILILVALLVITVTMLIIVRLSRKKVTESTDYPYQKQGLFTSPEISFYHILNKVVGSNAKVFGKVRIADVAEPRQGLSRSDRQKAFNRISGKHFDFLLCSNDNLSAICAIELDDSSHQSLKRQKRDEFLNGVCSAIDLPLIQIPVKAGYVIEEVKQILAPYLKLTELPKQEELEITNESEIVEKVCPKCSSSMVKRIAKRGGKAGKQFWGCTNYPKCNHTEEITAS
jgi:hypothetical protein